MDIIQSNESAKWVDGKLQFSYVQGFFRSGDSIYLAKWHNRQGPPKDIFEKRLVVTTDRGPVLQAEWTVLEDDDVIKFCYVKKPDLLALASKGDLEGLIRREITVCEVLSRHPHPNIARYLGCLTERGRVSALCFERCTETLEERFNPGHLKKRAFLESDRAFVTKDLRQKLVGFRAGVEHLHSLGLVHNDITPSNVMFNQRGDLVLIDFDSCRWLGEDLQSGASTKRTYEWHDRTVSTARVENDLDALAELEHWLFAKSGDDFLF